MGVGVGRSVGSPIGRSARSHSHGSPTFVVLISACWLIGLFGIEGGRLSSLQLPLIAGAGFLVYGLIGLLRRHGEEPRLRPMGTETTTPQSCVVIRQFGGRQASMRDHPAWGNGQIASPSSPAHTARVIDLNSRAGVLAGERVRQRRARAGERRADYIPLTGI